MSREFLVWGSLLGTCISAVMVTETLPYPVITYVYDLIVAVLNFYILYYGSKRCSVIGVNNHCYTILFLSICIFTVLFVVSVMIEFITIIYWLCMNDWHPAIAYKFHNWFICFVIETIIIILSSLFIIFWKHTKMCPEWSDENKEEQDYDETDCEFADYEEIENLPIE